MQTKRSIITMILLTGLILGYEYFVAGFRSRHPEYDWGQKTDQPETPATTEPSMTAAGPTTQNATTQTAMAQTATTQADVAAPTTMPAVAAAQGGGGAAAAIGVAPRPDGTDKPVTLGSANADDGTYALALKISPRGAGVDGVTLNKFKQKVNSPDRYFFAEPYAGHEDQTRSLATQTVTLNGQPIDLSVVDWSLESQQGADRATYGVTLNDAAGKPLAHVTKTFEVFGSKDAKGEETPAAGYEVNVVLAVANLTDRPLDVKAGFNGPTLPPPEVERGYDRQVASGFDSGSNDVVAEHQPIEDFKEGKPSRDLYRSEKGYPFLWAGTASVYFDALVRPEYPQQIAAATATIINPTDEGPDKQIALEFQSAALKAAPGAAVTLPLHLFFGPKQRELLNNNYYGQFPRAYNTTLFSNSSWLCGLCAAPFMMTLLVSLMGFFHLIFRDWGLSIIGLVVIVRLCLHPLTKRSQVSMMGMQKLSPELERLKKKFGDDKEGFSKAQMELYKDVGFTPIFGCAPMFLQFPIWISLYNVLLTEFSLRQAPFLRVFGVHLTWIKDLAKPDALISFATPFVVPFVGWHVYSLNVLPLCMAVVTFINAKYFTPRPAVMTPEQESQQKTMTYMTLLFPLMFYALPSGLNLYYLTSTTLGILESKRIRDHIKQKEADEKAGKIVIDAPPTIDGRRNGRGGGAAAAKPAFGASVSAWVARKVAEVQAKADEVKRQADQPQRGKGKA